MKIKWFVAIVLVLLIIAIIAIPAPASAGGGNGWAIGGALLGGFFLGSVLGPRENIIIGPAYPPPVYYPSPLGYYPPPAVYYQPQSVWIPDHYESRWQLDCERMYIRRHCYQTPITVFVPGHWEYR